MGVGIGVRMGVEMAGMPKGCGLCGNGGRQRLRWNNKKMHQKLMHVMHKFIQRREK